MANYTVTAANVHIYEGARTVNEKFGETMAAGVAAHYDAAAQEWLPLDANDDHSDRVKLGYTIVGAAADEFGIVAVEGPIDPGTTLTVGMPVMASTTAGGIAPVSDFSGYSGAWQYHFGYPDATNRLILKPHKTGAEMA